MHQIRIAQKFHRYVRSHPVGMILNTKAPIVVMLSNVLTGVPTGNSHLTKLTNQLMNDAMLIVLTQSSMYIHPANKITNAMMGRSAH